MATGDRRTKLASCKKESGLRSADAAHDADMIDGEASYPKNERFPPRGCNGCNNKEREWQNLSKTTKICKNSSKLLMRCLYL